MFPRSLRSMGKHKCTTSPTLTHAPCRVGMDNSEEGSPSLPPALYGADCAPCLPSPSGAWENTSALCPGGVRHLLTHSHPPSHQSCIASVSTDDEKEPDMSRR
ncbi:hypothetical protein CesoFtcFv8_006596 [Champsocephalus esox]|uniref:Uncharacterized protein n=1 Tax=Champsocephalus esox TaxID=159716 RepID=A0AAN8CJM7_9TELE|nr:hypothetical protein CesoFtcFv8_006596 [Champsocephalus esox]